MLNILNKLIGFVVILFNILVYIPMTYEILKSKGGQEGWGLLFLPISICFHLLILSGVFSFFNTNGINHKKTDRFIKTILFIFGVISILIIGVFATVYIWLLILLFALLFYFSIKKEIKTEQLVLIINSVGLILMIVFFTLLNLEF